MERSCQTRLNSRSAHSVHHVRRQKKEAGENCKVVRKVPQEEAKYISIFKSRYGKDAFITLLLDG